MELKKKHLNDKSLLNPILLLDENKERKDSVLKLKKRLGLPEPG